MDWTAEERKSFISRRHRCYRCFGRHHARSCTSKFSCRECGSAHHTLLHITVSISPRRVNFGEEVTLDTSQAESWHGEDGEGVLDQQPSVLTATSRLPTKCSLRTVTVWVLNPDTKARTVVSALLDDGANTTIVSTHLAGRLGLLARVTAANAVQIRSFGGQVQEYASISATLTIGSLSTNFRRRIHANVINEPVGDLKPVDWSLRKEGWPQLVHCQFIPPPP